MIDEYNLTEMDDGFIDGSMELGTESPLEMNENKRVRKMNESQFRNLIYEMTLKMLDKRLNEDDPMAAPAPSGAPADPNAAAAGGAMPGAPMTPAEDADTQGLPGKYAAKAKEFSKQQAQKVGDNTGGAPGFNPQGPSDKKNNRINERKKRLARRITSNVMNQLKEELCK